jgi:hypothetical protein
LLLAADDLAKKSQNSVGSIISLPIKYLHCNGMANDSSGDARMLKPVYPLEFEKVTLIEHRQFSVRGDQDECEINKKHENAK